MLLGVSRTIWLRTCYASELNETYENMSRGLHFDGIIDQSAILNDETLYAFEAAWDRILNRIPSLCDLDKYHTLEDISSMRDDACSPPETHHSFPLFDASFREVIMIYLLDRQALEENLITVLWLDNYGECVWWYRVGADKLLDLNGWLARKCGLNGMLELADGEEEGEDNGVYRKGSLFNWI